MPSSVRPPHRHSAANTTVVCSKPPPLKLPNEPEQEQDLEIPGTPPMDARTRRVWSDGALPANQKQLEARRLVEEEKLQSTEQRAIRNAAALVVQRLIRCFWVRHCIAKRLSAVGRPVELQVKEMRGLLMLCDFRNVTSLFYNVRVLKKPFGPFMFHFSSSKTTNVNLPSWTDKFMVPMLSSKCEIVITLIGVTNTGRMRFLGQAVVAMEVGWERNRTFTAPLSKWKFPVDESIVGLHRFVQGTVELKITPILSRMPCKSGQFLMAPPISTKTRRSLSFWSTQKFSKGSVASPAPRTPTKPASASPSRKKMVTRWGMLSDTTFYLYDNTTAKLLTSLDLATLQFIKSDVQPENDPSQLFPLKLYVKGTMYVLYVSSYALQQSWAYRINLHRRELLKL